MNIFLPLLTTLFLGVTSHVMPSAPKSPSSRNGYGSDVPNYMGRQPETSVPGDAAPIWLPNEQQAFYDQLLPSQQSAYLQLGNAQRKELGNSHKQSQEKEQAAAHQTMEKYLKGGQVNKKAAAGNPEKESSQQAGPPPELNRPSLTQGSKVVNSGANQTHVIPNADRIPAQKNSK